MERPPRSRVIVGRTGTKSPAIVFQQIALRWALNPRALFRSALDCNLLERKYWLCLTLPQEGLPENIQPEIDLLSSKNQPGLIREITYSRRLHPQADNYPDSFDLVSIDLINNRFTVSPDMTRSLPPYSFLYSCVHCWGFDYVPLDVEASKKLANDLLNERNASEERKKKAKDDKRATLDSTKPAPVACRLGLACPSKDPKHMSLFFHPDDEQRRQSWSKRAKQQSGAIGANTATKDKKASTPPDQLPSALVYMWVEYREDYIGTKDYSSRMEGVANNFLERFTKFASREVIGGTIYEKFANFDQLIQKEHFRSTYKRLKEKYAHWVSVFSDEKDNPIKYVYEDIGIAAHLVCLWEIDAMDKGLREKQSFVDLGCGNGFLVHILNSEGYRGRGIDLKKRKIWDKFGLDTARALIEVDFQPYSASFPDTDWLVGNHSDELTPWIPYLASKSGPHTNYFVLPCCFHDFDARFQANDNKLGQYKTYLNYIRSIGETCGFVVETEPLRIPSTKNIALIGRNRSFNPKDPAAVEAIAAKREKLLAGKKVANMKLRNEREAEHIDSRKRRRDNVIAAARDRVAGGDGASSGSSDSDDAKAI